MSKRSIQFQGGGERYGGDSQAEEVVDRPIHATAAQLAKRKIAQAKGSRRPRSESPLTSTGSIFEQASQSNLLGNNNNNPMAPNPSNPFNSNPSFTFGANGSTGGSFNSGGGSFTFGQQTQQSTPNTNSSFTFGAAPASNSFQFGQSPVPQSNGFGGGFSFGQPQNGDSGKTVFGEAFPNTANQKPAAPPATNGGFTFGQKPAETQGAPNPFGGFNTTQAAPEKPASDGWSSFLNQKPAETPKPATNGFAPSTNSIFSQTNGASQSNGVFAGFGQTQKTPNFKFNAQPEDNDASMMSPENTPQKQNTGIFGGLNGAVKEPVQATQPAQQAEAPKGSLFDRITRSPPKEAPNIFGGSLPPAAPTKNLFSQAPTPSATQSAPVPQAAQPQPSTVQTSMDKTKPEHYASTRELNEALLQHLKTQDLNKDLSTILKYYQSEVSKLQSDSIASAADSEGAAPAVKSTTGFGNSVLGKPASHASTTGLFGAASSTARTEQPAYPSLPDNASATSKLFQAALDKPAQISTPSTSLFAATTKTNGFTPSAKPAGESTPSLFAAKPAEAASTSSSLFAAKPAEAATTSSSLFTAKPAEAAKASSSLFTAKPVETTSTTTTSSLFAANPAATSASTPSLFAPKPTDGSAKSAGFTPAVAPSSGSSSFLSSFGQQAAQNAEKEKKRRRDEDYDSDEENEAEWEKRDAEEQEAKRSKIAEAAKTNGGFKFVPTGTTSSSIFGKPAEPAKTTADSAPTEDHTWKQGTPIKFGGAATSTTPAAAPKLGLFNSVTPSASLFSNTSKPAPAFSFGQPSSAPAPAPSVAQASSTPAPATTNADTAEQGEEGDAAPPEPQLDDMAVLLQSEKDESDVLLYIEKSKSRKLENRSAEGGSEKMTWIDKGHGPIWILRNKATGKTRVLQKIKDSGRAAMNFSVLAGSESLYKNEGMNGKAIMATFIDHIGDKDTNKLSQWAVIVGKKEDAAEFTRILREEQKKA
ncbi:hypothetical protein AMS68_002882 [Peltaster fructicola]|uniref:RanBD1 domain-containing protein n=1 Tax=Peltaster fructicola TaxID=286661 RepID=A0A6H0XRV6_9PEZI|nr:hypothetical protein AMS68_002882 [Peltaster fructicola]